MSNSDSMVMMMMVVIGGIGAVSASSMAYALVANSQTSATSAAPTTSPTGPPGGSSGSPTKIALRSQRSVYVTTTIAKVKYYLTAGGCFESVVDLQPKSATKSQLWKVSAVKDGSAYTFSRAAGPCTDLGALHFSSNVQADDPIGRGWASFAMVQSPSALVRLVPGASSRSNVVLRVAGAGYLSAGANVAGGIKLATTMNPQEALRFSFASS